MPICKFVKHSEVKKDLKYSIQLFSWLTVLRKLLMFDASNSLIQLKNLSTEINNRLFALFETMLINFYL